jgi:hypothetical protein
VRFKLYLTPGVIFKLGIDRFFLVTPFMVIEPIVNIPFEVAGVAIVVAELLIVLTPVPNEGNTTMRPPGVEVPL